MKQRSVLWGALAALVVGAGALVVAVGGGGGEGDGDGSPPLLPLAAGGDGAGDARAEAATDALAIGLASVYVPGDDLPELGGDAAAYRLSGEVTAADVSDLAEALGIDAEATETGPDPSTGTGGSWHAEDGEMALDVYGPDGSWSAYRMVADPGARDAGSASAGASGGGTSGSSGAAAPQNLVGGPSGPVAPGQTCPGTEPGADNVVDLCEPPVCPSGPATDPPLGCQPICLDQPDVATDAPRCEPPVCPQYAPGGDSPAVEPDDPCVSLPCPGNAADDTRCVPTPTVPSPVDPAPTDPDPKPIEPAPAPPTTVPPADLPSEDEARSAALDLLAATGADVDGAEVTAENLVSMWSITVEPSVDGRPAPGLAMYVGIGDAGRIESATGRLTSPDELGEYPLIDTRAAITRLNEGWGFVSPLGDVTASGAAESSTDDEIAGGATSDTTSAPDVHGPVMTIEPPPVSDLPGDTPVGQPTEIEVTGAEIVLVIVPSWDDSGTYLVPGYRFTAADDSQPTVPAVTDDMLEPPPSVEPQPEPMPPAGGEGDSGDRVEVALYHCGFEELRHGDRRWAVEDPPFDETNAPPEFTGRGTFVVDNSGEKAVYTDASGIAVTFTAVGDDWSPPPCD